MVEKHREFVYDSNLPLEVVRQKSIEFWEPQAKRNTFNESKIEDIFRFSMMTKLTAILIVPIDLIIDISSVNGKTHVVVKADLRILRPIWHLFQRVIDSYAAIL